jgi:hypothetical protein
MASTIPPPHVPLAPGSSSLLDAPRPGAPVPFPHPSPSPSRFLFGVLLYYFSVCFFEFFFVSFCVSLSFFTVSADLLRASFATLRPLLSFFRAPTATSFHRALLCTGSTYTRSVSFSVFFLLVFSYVAFLFPIFHYYLLVIML